MGGEAVDFDWAAFSDLAQSTGIILVTLLLIWGVGVVLWATLGGKARDNDQPPLGEAIKYRDAIMKDDEPIASANHRR